MEKKIIIYGAGLRGRWCLDFLIWRGLKDCIYGFCDKNAETIGIIEDIKVFTFEQLKDIDLPYVIAIADEKVSDKIYEILHNEGKTVYRWCDLYKALQETQTTFLRERCAYHHAKYNDKWFVEAENEDEVAIFWGENSVFKKMFDTLNLHNVIELACGRGRHVSHYIQKADHVTLVDILQENICICKERFGDYQGISYYRNNGYNLERLDSDRYTALFTYDSMVHFELMDVYEYLKDIYRVLEVGGKALFHHSNYYMDYSTDFSRAPHARCFMSKEIFAYLAIRCGFRIKEQIVIDWHGVKGLDCITFLEK